MPAGQTPHTVVLYAHHDLVDKVQPGDRLVMFLMYSKICILIFPNMHFDLTCKFPLSM